MINEVKNLFTVILAAGKGTRMKSDLPKVLHQIKGKTLINHVIKSALELQANHNKIIVVVGHQKEKVIESVQKDFPLAPIEFVTQEPQLGTAHAVLKTSPLIRNHMKKMSSESLDSTLVLVLSGDVPLIQTVTLRQMLRSHKKNHEATVGYCQVKNPHGLGRIIRNSETKHLEKIIEEKDISEEGVRDIKEINTGIYLFKAETLLRLLPEIKNENRQKEYYLPDVIKLLTKENQLVNLTSIPEKEAQGINTREQLVEAEENM